MSTVEAVPSDSQPQELPSSQVSPSTPLPDKAKKQKFACGTCGDVLSRNYMCRPCRKCKEAWCHECIRGLFSTAVKDQERMPARCCQNIIHHGVAKDIVDDKILAKYKLRYEEFCTPRPFYCPVPTCSTFISQRKLKSADHHKRLACPTCATRLCTKCRQTAQQGHQCPTAQDPVLATIRSLKYKLCPKCGTGVLKMYGCDHIRCHCGAHWCWSCERSIDRCFSNPCQAQLDDENDAEPDTEDEEDVFEAEDRATTVAATDGVPYEHPTPLEPAPALSEPPAPEAFILPAPRPRTPVPVVATELSPFNPPAPPPSNPHPPAAPDVSAEPVTLAEENLDDPDEIDWENQDMDFGGEPADEGWDIWGCPHKCRRLNREDIHEKWLKLENLDCQNCFEHVRLDREGSIPKDASVEDRLAWLCKKCGIIFCEQCRKDNRARQKR